MAFWGIEVKPGKPVTHRFDLARGRLRISQATLGIGSSSTKSLVQCNIGDKSPVFLCALLPDKTESCHLDLEFEEADDVIFSVIGPRSAYLTGYYLSGRYPSQKDSSESYGEDIGNSDEESFRGSEEDKYEDSFIDDGDPEIFPPSPVSSDTACVEEMLDKKKPKEKKTRCKRLKKRCQLIDKDDNSHMHNHEGASPLRIDNEGKKARHKLLKKRYQLIESDDDNSHMRNHKDASPIKSDDEDKLPISTLVKSRKSEAEERMEAEKGKTGDEKIANDGPNAQTPDDGVNPLKFDGNVNIVEDSIKFEAVVADSKRERGSDSTSHGLLLSDGHGADLTKSKKKRKRITNEALEAEAKARADGREGDQCCDALLPSTIPDLGNGIKPKKKREQFDGEVKDLVHGGKTRSVLTEEKAQQSGGFPKSSENTNSDIAHNSMVNGDKSEDKKTKRKKKSKPNRKDNVGNDFHLLSKEEKNKPDNGYNEKNTELKLPQARTLSNGLVIEELENGKLDGKMATSGKKVKVHYVGKLRQSGKIFDSNVGKAPSKFRLGAEGVIEGWNLGLDGMRVGGKRRLTIPPNMGYGSEGAGENIPPNSWLVYEVELVGVR